MCGDHIANGACQHGRKPTVPRRRDFLKPAARGGAVSLYQVMNPHAAFAATTDAMLLNCMDFRLTDDSVRWMDGRCMNDNHHHIVFAAASLGAMIDNISEWGAPP
jgi:hypothetical protein